MESNNDIKQVIVMRKDLNMRKGKMIAQGAHASLAVILKQMNVISEEDTIELNVIFKKKSPLDIWLNGNFKKVTVACNSEDELLAIYNKAKKAKLPCAIITDSGLTEFHGISTKTCLAIGPAESSKIDKITGDLKLL